VAREAAKEMERQRHYQMDRWEKNCYVLNPSWKKRGLGKWSERAENG